MGKAQFEKDKREDQCPVCHYNSGFVKAFFDTEFCRNCGFLRIMPAALEIRLKQELEAII